LNESEIANLTRLKHVVLVGYIDVDDGNQAVEVVQAQIDRYANLRNTASNLTLDGVYFDQTPSEGSNTDVEYLKQITSYAKNSHNLGANFVSNSPLPSNPRWFIIRGRSPPAATSSAKISPSFLMVRTLHTPGMRRFKLH